MTQPTMTPIEIPRVEALAQEDEPLVNILTRIFHRLRRSCVVAGITFREAVWKVFEAQFAQKTPLPPYEEPGYQGIIQASGEPRRVGIKSDRDSHWIDGTRFVAQT